MPSKVIEHISPEDVKKMIKEMNSAHRELVNQYKSTIKAFQKRGKLKEMDVHAFAITHRSILNAIEGNLHHMFLYSTVPLETIDDYKKAIDDIFQDVISKWYGS